MLEVASLRVDLNRMRILQEISLQVGEHEVVAVIGPNGAGKTTLLRTISGLSPVTSGTITFNGEKISGMKPHKVVTKGISQIPERGRVFPLMSVYENLILGSWIQKDSANINRTLKRVYELFPILEKRKSQMGGTLSGGERQMVAIGRALMADPKLLLLDEPTLGLAPIICNQLGQIIADLNKQGTSILIVEQNAVLALSISHRAYVMDTGNIVLSGMSSDLKKDEKVRKAYLAAD